MRRDRYNLVSGVPSGRLGSTIHGLPSMFGAFRMFGPVYQMSSLC